MKKSILNLGNVLNKTEQKKVNGGDFIECLNCYDNCILNSRNRIELGICYDYCSNYVC